MKCKQEGHSWREAESKEFVSSARFRRSHDGSGNQPEGQFGYTETHGRTVTKVFCIYCLSIRHVTGSAEDMV
jgi:hypothetical protein